MAVALNASNHQNIRLLSKIKVEFPQLVTEQVHVFQIFCSDLHEGQM